MSALAEAPLVDVEHALICVDPHCLRCTGERPARGLSVDELDVRRLLPRLRAVKPAPVPQASRADVVERPWMAPVTIRCAYCANWAAFVTRLERVAEPFAVHAASGEHRRRLR